MPDPVTEVPVAEPTLPIVADASTTAYVTKGLTLGIRQILLASVGAAAAHGILPAGYLDGGKAETYSAIAAFVALAAWGQYREAHQHSKIVVLAGKVDDIFARVINARKPK